MNETPAPQGPSKLNRLTITLNPWLQIFLTIIAGTIVAIIAWTVIGRFLHILVLLLASSLVAYIAGPGVDRMEKGGTPRIMAILVVYLVLLGGLAIGLALLVGPLTGQLQALTDTLPKIVDTRSSFAADLDRFFQQHGIAVNIVDLRNKLFDYISGAGTQLLGGTLSVVAGLVSFVTDLLLILAITFYLLLDGRSMHNHALRLLPPKIRERWFFVEATLNRVLGGYIRGQLVVALTVGLAAGLGCAALGVHFPLVIGLLAFLFEFVPMLGPVLGMIPAVIIAFFQSPTLALWTTVYFIVLQQVESNVIVPRVSGHAVGLHPLAALLALLAGFELGGLAGALLAVPIAGVLYIIALAIYSDVTGDTEMLVATPRRTAYDTAYNSLRGVFVKRREPRSGTKVRTSRSARNGTAGANGTGTQPANGNALDHLAPQTSSSIVTQSTEDHAEAAAVQPLAPARPGMGADVNDRLASIARDQAQLISRFEADERNHATVDASEKPAVPAQEPQNAGPAADAGSLDGDEQAHIEVAAQTEINREGQAEAASTGRKADSG